MGKNAIPCGTFTCPGCTIQENIPHNASQQAHEGASRLVMLEGSNLAVSSQDAYASALRRYTKCMLEVYLIPESLALPPGPQEHVPIMYIKLFMGWAAGIYKPATITTTISALADWHRSKGIEVHASSSKAITRLSQAIKLFQGAKGVTVAKQGISKTLVIKCLETMRQLKHQHPHMEDLFTRDASWIVMGFFGLMRRSELIALTFNDVEIKKEYVVVHIRKSKTDQEGKGATVVLPAKCRDGIHVRRIVQALVNMRVKQGAATSDPILTSWDLNKFNLSHSPLSSGQALSCRLRYYLTEISTNHPHLGINPNEFAMHSLRRGGVVAAWANGLDIETIRDQGRWKSDAIKAYLVANLQVKLNFASSI